MDISKLIDKLQDTADGGISRTLARLEERNRVMFRSAAEEAVRRNGFATGSRSALEAAVANQAALDGRIGLYREVNALAVAQRAFEDASRLGVSAGLQRATIEAIERRGPSEHALSFAQQANAIMERAGSASALADAAIRMGALEALAKPLAYAVSPFAGGVLATQMGWEQRLSAQMKLIERPWMLPDDPARSMLGFAHLARISDAVRYSPPYSPDLNHFLREELGEFVAVDEDATPDERDDAAIEAGMRDELIAFPRAEYRVVLGTAGFALNLPPLPIPLPVEGENPGASFDPVADVILCQVEVRLRMLVEEKLTQAAGGHWIKTRVPGAVRKRWQEKIEAERARRRPVYSAIYYADLMDLETIICCNDNWRVFNAVFPNKGHLSQSLQHLSSIRNDVSHRRPLGMAQTLRLFAEATSILRALGVHIFQ